MTTKGNWRDIDLGLTAAILTSAILLVTLASVQRKHNSQLETVLAELDTAVAQVRIRDFELLGPGDTLPSIRLVAWDGTVTALNLVATSKQYRYIYFYRSDCPPCEVLAPFFEDIPHARRDSIAFIKYHASDELMPDTLRGHYAWRNAGVAKRYIRAIPTLAVINADGRILTVAHASMPSTAKVLDMFKLVDEQAVDAAVDRARATASLAPTVK